MNIESSKEDLESNNDKDKNKLGLSWAKLGSATH